MEGPQDASPSVQPADAGDGLASTLDQLAVLMAQAQELASWASSTQTVAPEPVSTEPDGEASPAGEARVESPSLADEEPVGSRGEDPIGAALMSMVADGRIAAVVVTGEGSAEVLGEPRCIEESSLAALGSLAPKGAVLEVTTTKGDLRALRVGSWTFAVEVGAAVPDDVDTLLGELLALSDQGVPGVDP